jgi:FkbM family methyltransferase
MLRRLAGHPLRWRALRCWRAASVLRPAPKFVVGELRGDTRRYSVASGATLLLRHGSRDVDLVNEIFGATGAYEPPDTVAPALRGPLRILDLGGNVGMFGAFALGRWNVRGMTSVEPDPENAALLQATIRANHATDCWTMRRVAVSNAPGVITFLSGQFADSRRAEPDERGIEVQTVDLFGLDHDVDLLKIDIEGGEWPILQDPRLMDLGARIVVLEWHWRFAPQADAHRLALDLLNRAGYAIRADRLDTPLGSTGLVWASRP